MEPLMREIVDISLTKMLEKRRGKLGLRNLLPGMTGRRRPRQTLMLAQRTERAADKPAGRKRLNKSPREGRRTSLEHCDAANSRRVEDLTSASHQRVSGHSCQNPSSATMAKGPLDVGSAKPREGQRPGKSEARRKGAQVADTSIPRGHRWG